MTISSDNYFRKWPNDRKKEPRFLAVIDKDSCTSCTACAAVCPVDCIYEVVRSTPSESFHAIDTQRCIGCQLCYRIPSESSERYTLEVCPWNAIDMLRNPNQDGDWVLKDYYLGDDDLPWGKLDEYAFQMSINGHLRVAAKAERLNAALARFAEPVWGQEADSEQWTICQPPERHGDVVTYEATEEGRRLLTFLFNDYSKLYLD